MRVLILLVVCITAVSASKLHFLQNNSLDEEWKTYKSTFSKTYPSEIHEALRRLQWEKNLLYIQKHNLEADMGKYSYRLGMNEYGDLSGQEYREMLLCLKMNKTRSSTGSLFLPPNNVKLPQTVDWRRHGYVTPVKNQGQCGSCWAFSTTGSLEGQHFRKTGNLVSLSEQNLVDCSRLYGNEGCGGGWMDNGFRYIKANGGIDTEMSYPYEARDRPCRFKRSDIGATVESFQDIRQGDEYDLMTAVGSVGPVSVAIDASHSSFHLYKSGVYDEPQCSTSALDHAVLVVGYGTDNGNDYWLVKNSWGSSWGIYGYIKMSRNRRNQCGIATKASYPLV